MATTSKKTTPGIAASTTAKKLPAKKTAEETSAVKKPAAKTTAAAKKTAAAPANKAGAAKPLAAEDKPAKVSVPRKSANKKNVSHEQRYHMIATAAYYLAERRGFSHGYEMQDWISAEADIDAMLNG